MKKKRIGVYGGSFDPPHLGHALVVKYAIESGYFDEVWIMPCPENPIKSISPKASSTDRLKMCEIIACKIPNVRVSDFEIKNGINRAWVALERLHAENPTSEFKWIVGKDCLDKRDGLWGWYKGKELIEKYGILEVPRGGEKSGFESEHVLSLPDTPDFSSHIQTSSTCIRKLLKEGKSITFLVPEEIETYILNNRLYK